MKLCSACIRQALNTGAGYKIERLALLRMQFSAIHRTIAKDYECLACRAVWHVDLYYRHEHGLPFEENWSMRARSGGYASL